jgi:Gpi18-like mannosyltransferase
MDYLATSERIDHFQSYTKRGLFIVVVVVVVAGLTLNMNKQYTSHTYIHYSDLTRAHIMIITWNNKSVLFRLSMSTVTRSPVRLVITLSTKYLRRSRRAELIAF